MQTVDIATLKNIIDYGVVGILLVMSFLTIWFWIERLIFFRKVDLSFYKTKESLEIDLTNNVTIISSIASNAPYIGLLGTVLAIIVTFYQISLTNNLETQVIMSSLALALKATALGLMVAIPAIFFTNHIARKIEVLLTKWDIANR
jgi:biopolymer transport protein ExbB